MVQPWADQPFTLIPTSKVTKPTASQDAVYIADSMAQIHNMLLRSLNAIYLQTPYVTKGEDIHDLLQYSIFWTEFVNNHHHGEETFFFPEIEKVTGEKGIMDKNLEQHQGIHAGIEEWAKYTKSCFNKSEEFDSAKFIKLIDAFASILRQHLSDEIPTLLALDKYDIRKVKAAFQQWDKQMQAKADPPTQYPMGMGCVDWSDKNDKFPDVPFFVPYLVNYLYARKYRSVWRFSPNTLMGVKRPLTFLPKDEE